jgi:hypothetical protein
MTHRRTRRAHALGQTRFGAGMTRYTDLRRRADAARLAAFALASRSR